LSGVAQAKSEASLVRRSPSWFGEGGSIHHLLTILYLNYDFTASWQGSFYPPLRMADLVLGHKADFFEPCLLFK